MVNVAGNILTPAINKQLLALQNTARSIDVYTNQLATGKRVNSAIDNPQNFFTAFSLTSKASDFNSILDGISQSIRSIQEADNSLQALDDLVGLAESRAQELQSEILSLSETRGSVSDLILADNPDLYYKLDETSGTTAVNYGTAGATLNGVYQGGTGQKAGNLYFSDIANSASFDGINDRITLPNNNLINTDPAGYPEKTLELFFKAEDVNSGRQVLYEQGGGSNAISIYIDSGQVRVVARDAGDFGPFDVKANIKSGEVYHVALTIDSPNSLFTGYLNGEVIGTGVVTKPMARHGGASALGRKESSTYFHDGGSGGGSAEHFKGQISDFASYNQVISADKIKARYEASLIEETKAAEVEVQKLLEPINPLLEDSSYNGVNLLLSDSLNVNFNVEHTSQLKISGADFSLSEAGLSDVDFSKPSSFNSDVNKIASFRKDIERFNSSLASDLNIIEARDEFTQKNINTFQSGADDLTLVDENEASAQLLSAQAGQAVALETLSLATKSPNILDLLSADPQGSNTSNSLL